MARKKEVIEQEWLRAETALDAAHKKCIAATITDKDLIDYKAKYEVWKKLLAEAQKKIGEWKNEKDAKRLEWMKLVQSRATKLNPGYIAEISKAETHLKAVKSAAVLDTVIRGIDMNADPTMDKIEAFLKTAKAEVAKKDYDVAATEHGKALNYLKNVAGFVSKGGAAKAVASEAALHGLKASDIDTNNAGYKAKLQVLQNRHQQLEAEADRLGDQIDAMEAEALNHREVASPNNDPQYKAHLKKCFEDYRTVLAFASNGLARLKQLETNVPKLEQLANRTVTAGTVPPVVKSALQLHGQMMQAYQAVDTHIQQTIRTTESTFSKQATTWGITPEDRLKNLAPVMNRAFSTNFQCKSIQEKAADRLQDSLEMLAKKFNSKEAETGAAQLDRA